MSADSNLTWSFTNERSKPYSLHLQTHLCRQHFYCVFKKSPYVESVLTLSKKKEHENQEFTKKNCQNTEFTVLPDSLIFDFSKPRLPPVRYRNVLQTHLFLLCFQIMGENSQWEIFSFLYALFKILVFP